MEPSAADPNRWLTNGAIIVLTLVVCALIMLIQAIYDGLRK